jgi:hypothetical protein
MTLTMTPTSSAAANTKGEHIREIARPLQELKKCRYCDYRHWDEFDLKFHEEMHTEYCEDKEIIRQKRREYELMLIRRFNLTKEIRLLQRSFAANEVNIKKYETDEDTKELACKVREAVWEKRARENWCSDTSFVGEHLELGYYVLTDHERKLAAVTAVYTSDLTL